MSRDCTTVERAHGPKRRRGRRVVGVAAAVGAFLTFGLAPLATAPPASADFGLEDLLDPSMWFDGSMWTTLTDSLFDPSAVADPTAGLDGVLAQTSSWADGLFSHAADSTGDALSAQSVAAPDFDQWLQQDIDTPLNTVFNDLTGHDLIGNSTAPALAGATVDTTPATVSVPLTMGNTTEPLVDISIGGAGDIPVVVDTGSNGLVVPWYDIGWQNIGWPTGFGVGSYSGGLDYLYMTLPTTVDFGGGAITSQTPVDAVLFAWNPTTYWPTSLESFLSGTGGADGILGIGANAVGPNTPGIGSAVISALPGDLSQGVLIDEAGKQLVFGPNPLGDAAYTLAGSPNTALEVSINGGPLQPVPALVDSGGVYGTMPSSVTGFTPTADGYVPAGTHIAVYGSDGHTLLYQYTTTAANAPAVVGSGASMNTGYIPFAQQPIWVGTSGNGTTVFGNPGTGS